MTERQRIDRKIGEFTVRTPDAEISVAIIQNYERPRAEFLSEITSFVLGDFAVHVSCQQNNPPIGRPRKMSKRIISVSLPEDQPELRTAFATLASKQGWRQWFLGVDESTGETVIVQFEPPAEAAA